MRNCCKVPSALSARHLTLIHNKMSLTVNPGSQPGRTDNENFTRYPGRPRRCLLAVLPKKWWRQLLAKVFNPAKQAPEFFYIFFFMAPHLFVCCGSFGFSSVFSFSVFGFVLWLFVASLDVCFMLSVYVLPPHFKSPSGCGLCCGKLS